MSENPKVEEQGQEDQVHNDGENWTDKIWEAEREYRAYLQNPTNVLAERDDSVVKTLCYGP